MYIYKLRSRAVTRADDAPYAFGISLIPVLMKTLKKNITHYEQKKNNYKKNLQFWMRIMMSTG